MSQSKRLEEIGAVLIRHGFEKVVPEIIPLNARLRLRGFKPQGREEETYTRLRKALTDLGPVFIKFGQYMKTRPDILPEDLIEELEYLVDKVEPIPFTDVKNIIENKIGKIQDIFIEIREEPVSSGSLSQKHYAVLKNGQKVMIKIKRPEVYSTFDTDLKALDTIAKNSGKISEELKLFNFPEAVKDFSTQISRELDFISEGRSAELIKVEVEGLPKIRVPKIYWDYTNEDILVLEYFEGTTINKVDEIKSNGIDPRDISTYCMNAYLKQIFVEGYYHGDPDPTNLLVTKNGEIVFLDFGLMGVLREDKREKMIGLIGAVHDGNIDDIVYAFKGLGLRGRSEDVELVKDDFYVEHKEHTLKETRHTGSQLGDTVALLHKHSLILPMQSMLTITTLLKLEKDMKELDESFSLIYEIDRYLDNMIRKNLLDRFNVIKPGGSLADTLQNTKDLPQHLNDALLTVTEGPIRFKLDYENLNNLADSIDKATYRLLIIVALFLLASQNFSVFNFPFSALIAYIMAVSIGAYAIYKLFL
jgi:ubiquinone biosynthesis protein